MTLSIEDATRFAQVFKGLVDGVVHNLIHKVVQTTRTRRTDIHAGAHTHGFKALADLNV